MTDSNERRTNTEQNTALDEVLTTQPELGPSIPDGGFGWVVFIATLFFQSIIPCLAVNFGVFLAFSKLKNGTADDNNIQLWDDKFLFVSLYYCISKGFFDPVIRTATSHSTTPRLMSVVGTCLTCAGLLFIWMGMTSDAYDWLFALAGILTGLGSDIILFQCQTILHQYFRLKLPILEQISHAVMIFGFIIAPIVLGRNILETSITRVIMWYQALILQGLIVSLIFKKPQYLKVRKINKPYQFIMTNPDDEEDILSKNVRELQIRRHSKKETYVKTDLDQEASTSSERKNWVKFDDETEDDLSINHQKWETFEDDNSSPRINNLSIAEEMYTQTPSSLFTDNQVNNNNTYAYDEIITEPNSAYVFEPNTHPNENFQKLLAVMKELSFYKSLLMKIANTYSTFIFYALYPSFLYIEAETINIRYMTELIAIFSLVNLIFLIVAYWINVDKKRRAIYFWVFYWLGSVGYFMISDYHKESLILIGGIQVVLSIEALETLSKPLLKLPAKGGTSSENTLLSVISSLSLLLFLVLDVSFKSVFRLIAILHFFSGSLWLINFIYKKLRIR